MIATLDMRLDVKPTYLACGAVGELMMAQERAVLIEGRVGTGKTLGLAWKIHTPCCDYPIRALVVAKTRKSLTDSFMVTYENAVLSQYADARYVLRGREREGRGRYRYRSRAELVVGSFEDPDAFLSSEYDIIAFIQAEQLPMEGVETVAGRLRNKSGYKPKQLLFDANPGGRNHWLLQWAKAGKLRLLHSTIQDNPHFWDHARNCLTPEGEDYEATTDLMSGVRRKRMRDGIWCSPEGAIFQFEPDRHVIAGELKREKHDYWRLHFISKRTGSMDSVALVRFGVGVDWGTAKPGAMVVVGYDTSGKAYVVEQYYQHGQTTEWWARIAAYVDQRFSPRGFICDSAEKDRVMEFQTHLGTRHGRQVAGGAYKGNKSVYTGTSELQQALIDNRLVILADSLKSWPVGVEPDNELPIGAARCLQDELETAVWRRDAKTGEVFDEYDETHPRSRHAIDALRYEWMGMRHVDSPDELPQPDMVGMHLGFDPATGEAVLA